MSFAETRFPADISYGSAGGPEFSTDVVVTQSGHEQRNSNWVEARAKFNVAYGVKNAEQLAALISFFRARKGQAEGFRFKDWTDFEAIGQLLGTGNGSITQFQLIKTYGSRTRVITKPVSGTVKIYLNSVLQTGGVTVNTTTGIVTLAAAPASGVSVLADFEFDVPVRFATDRLSATLDSYGSYSARDVPLVEVRV